MAATPTQTLIHENAYEKRAGFPPPIAAPHQVDQTLMDKRYVKPLALVSTLVLLTLAFLHLKVSLRTERLYRPYIYDAGYRIPAPKVLAVASLNHRSAAANIVWVTGILYLGETIVANRSPDEATDYARSIATLDPFFYKVYSWHSAARMMLSDYPESEDIEAANDILKMGMRVFPGDWKLPFEVAANYIGFTRGVDDDLRIIQLREAARHAEIAAGLPDSPSYLSSLALALHRRADLMEKGIDWSTHRALNLTSAEKDFLFRQFLYAPTPEQRRRALLRIEQAGLEDDLVDEADQLRRARAIFLGKSAASYLTTDLQLLTRELLSPALEPLP